MGLDLALERECELLAKATNISCVYHPPTDRIAVSEQNEIILFRCAQEMLNNVIKHSGADRVEVTLGIEGNQLQLLVQDNGQGFDPRTHQEGLGLISLRNRVEMIDGVFAIQSSSDVGTIVSITSPQNQME